MLILIDGYNLLYAMGFATRKMAAPEFQRSRERLLNWLNEVHPPDCEMLIVFDGPRIHRTPGETKSGKIRVQFSRGEFADDTIESLLKKHTRSMGWILVSNDTRLHESARRRECRYWSHTNFLDYLISDHAKSAEVTTSPKPAKVSKPDQVTRDEVDFWMREFGVKADR